MATSPKEEPMSVGEEKGSTTNTTGKDISEDEYPPAKKLFLIMLAIYLTMFLVALDRTIIGTAIPQITDDFHSIGDVGWYGSAYLLTSCAFQLIYGRVYTFYSPKWILLGAIGIFELGSIVCAASPNSNAFIVGRAIAGLGAAGIFSGCINIMVISIPLHRRPMYQGIFGAIFGVSSVIGPLLGGAFTTSHLTWRWCFWINLPVGAVVLVILIFILHTPPSKNTDTIKQQIVKLDPYGTAVFLPGIVCLLLALQWGGTTYAWSNARIIVLLILAVLLLATFIFIQFRSGDNATVPIRIITQRSIASGAFFTFISTGAMFIAIYYLPLWFQAIKGASAVHSGIDTLPLVLGLVAASIFAGALTSKTGYYVPQLIASTVLLSIGAGLLTTFQVNTNSAHWIGYQFLFGFGLGLGMQQSGMAAQTCLAKEDVMTGVSIIFFFQGLGGSIWLTVGQTIFSHTLVADLKNVAGLDAALIINSGATELRHLVPAQVLPAVLRAYNTALTDNFKLAVACAVTTVIGGLTMEWKSVNKGIPKPAVSEQQVEAHTESLELGQQDRNDDQAKLSETANSEAKI